MPLGDVAGEALSGAFRFIARVVFEIVVDVILSGTGAMMTGLVFWGTAITVFFPGVSNGAVT